MIETAIRITPLSPVIPGYRKPAPALATADMLSNIAQCNNKELFHTANGTAFADIIIAGHRETWPIRSKRFRAFLKRSCYHATGEAASTAEIRSALDLLEARAQFDGAQRPVHVRIAEQAGHVCLDLANDHRCVVDNGPDGWRAIASRRCPVRQLYTDDEEVLFQAARPILLNGIDDVIRRPDLTDWAIFLTLAPIGEAQQQICGLTWINSHMGCH